MKIDFGTIEAAINKKNRSDLLLKKREERKNKVVQAN